MRAISPPNLGKILDVFVMSYFSSAYTALVDMKEVEVVLSFIDTMCGYLQ